MPDLRGGFPGFLSKAPPPKIVDGISYILVLDEIKHTEESLKSKLNFGFGKIEIVKSKVSRSFTQEEYEMLPQKIKDSLQKSGVYITSLPNFSAATVKPLGEKFPAT